MWSHTKNVCLFLSLMSGVAAADQPLLRKTVQAVNDPASCNDVKSESDCKNTVDEDSSEPCVWCESKAISSVCVSKEQSENLPPAVFHCDTTDEDASSSSSRISEDRNKKYNFLYQDNPNVEYKLNIVEHNPGDESSDICDSSSKSISGYMDIKGSKYDENGENKHLFFWMFEKRPSDNSEEKLDADDIPFVIWLTGGPGCSSTLALLSENGPCSVNKDGESTSLNPNSWTEAAHVLWLDQPAGVGFSYGDENDYNEQMISEDAYYFLQAFFETHPEYAKNPLYITGESYAGHYVPAIAHRIYEGNQNYQTSKDDLLKLNLQGIAIGNGLTNPQEQYKWYPEMVYNNSHHIKVVSEEVYEGMKEVVPKCVKLIEACNSGDGVISKFACQTAFLVCNAGLTSPYQMTGLNPYDIRKTCDVRPLCYDFSYIQTFLNSEKVQTALNVDKNHPHNWASCNFNINMKFHVDWMKDFSPYVADLLNADMRVLVYVGDVDFICNYLGNHAWTKKLEWDHTKEFNDAGLHNWKDHGEAQSFEKFTYLQVYDAGHMVPSDQPEVALDMLKTFLSGGTF